MPKSFISQLPDVHAVMQGTDIPNQQVYQGRVQVGVDLGTAFFVLLVLDENQKPLAGAYQFAQVVRDGLVVDYIGAIDLLTKLKAQVEAKLGLSLTEAATAYPPGVQRAEVRATENVLYSAGLACRAVIDEPSAANKVLALENGAVVDVGGGTTGIAIIENGQVVYTADEPTGGTHFSLVIAGAKGLNFEEAERFKRDPANHSELLPLVRPVMEKVAAIIDRHIAPYHIERIFLVGGTSAFTGIEAVAEEWTGIPTTVPPHPMFVTPFGIALSHEPT